MAGLGALALHQWLARLYGFPTALVLFIGAANLAYASYSGSLAVLASRGSRLPRRAIDVLVMGNLAWVAVCGGILIATREYASVFGVALVAFEACFVASLAVAEYRYVRPAAQEYR